MKKILAAVLTLTLAPFHHDAVYENQWIVDKAAYTTYKCSKCGATK